MDVAAQKPKFKGYFNEFGNGVNPWNLMATHGVFDVSDLSGLKKAYDVFGMCVIRRVFSPAEARAFYDTQISFTGLGDADVKRVFAGEVKPVIGGSPACNDERFWPFVVNENTKKVAREIFGGRQATELATSAGAHYSARGLHRDYDKWYKMPKSGMTVENGNKSCLRMLMYPSKRGRTAGTFGVIPFSHRRDLYEQYAAQVGITRTFDWYDGHRDLIKKAVETGETAELDEMDSYIDWVSVEDGDIVIMDARMQHSGDFITGPRYLFTTSFVVEDEHILRVFRQRWKTGQGKCEVEYYRFLNKHGLASDALLRECEEHQPKPSGKGVNFEQGTPVASTEVSSGSAMYLYPAKG